MFRTHEGPWFARPVAVGAIVVLVLLLIKADTLTEPPSGDAARSVHAAAITLAETGFDYPSLLASPGYLAGGPNTHSLSPYTATAAVAYRLLNPPAALVALHLLSFFLAALTVIALVKLGSRYLPPGKAVGAAFSAMALPVVLTQFGMLYLEAPVLAATAWALLAATERRWLQAALFSMLATGIKPSGIVTAAAIALFVFTFHKSLRHALRILVPSVIVFGVQASLSLPGNTLESAALSAFAGASWGYLRAVPDITVIVVLATSAAFMIRWRESSERETELASIWIALLIAFVGFYTVSWSALFTTLPRYYSHILPIAVLLIFVEALRRSASVFAGTLIAVSLFSIINFNGTLYPLNSHNHLALIERSDRYDDLIDLETAVARSICELPQDVPVLFTRAERALLAYPALGYANCPDRAGPIVPSGTHRDLDELPQSVFITFEGRWLGGRDLQQLISDATASPDWSVETYKTIDRGGFKQDIYQLRRLDVAG